MEHGDYHDVRSTTRDGSRANKDLTGQNQFRLMGIQHRNRLFVHGRCCSREHSLKSSMRGQFHARAQSLPTDATQTPLTRPTEHWDTQARLTTATRAEKKFNSSAANSIARNGHPNITGRGYGQRIREASTPREAQGTFGEHTRSARGTPEERPRSAQRVPMAGSRSNHGLPEGRPASGQRLPDESPAVARGALGERVTIEIRRLANVFTHRMMQIECPQRLNDWPHVCAWAAQLLPGGGDARHMKPILGTV